MPLIYLSGFLAFCKTAIFVLGYISNNSLFPEPLSQEEEAEYLQKYMEGDEEARNILIERNLRLVAHICKKYNIPNVDNDDLISIGTIGLIKGINTFNTNKGVRLATYASRCIENAILIQKTHKELFNILFQDFLRKMAILYQFLRLRY